VILGFIGQAFGSRRFDYEWLAIDVGAFAAGFVAGGYLGALTEWGWRLDGLYVLPALLGAVLVGGLLKVVFTLAIAEEPAR
jgi:hypothetical protein